MEYSILIIGYIFGFYMAWNIGANDVANSMASSVGAKAITIRQALLIAGVLNLVGAVFLGSHVADTIRKGIVSTDIMTDPRIICIGSLSALISASLWVMFATWKSLPVSTTHSIVGSMIGYGIMAGGFSCIKWVKLGAVIASWIISPFFSIIISFLMIKFIFKVILSSDDPLYRSILLAPYFIGLAVAIVILSFLFKTPLGKNLSLSLPTACIISIIAAFFLGHLGKKIILRKINLDNSKEPAEEIFRYIQVGTSCYVALAQGANDVANAIAPLALIFFIIKTGTVGDQIPIPLFLLFYGGIGIAAGIWIWGYRVMETIGTKITHLNNTRGFSVEFAAATTVLLASKLGLPVSTTHAAVGGVIGVGLARGMEAVNFSIIGQIIVYWLLTVPAAAITSMIVYKILMYIY